VLVVGLHNESYALHQKKNPKPHGNKTSCEADLNICNTDLDSCQTDLVMCQASVCNNGVAEFSEECDGTNLQGATCATEGFQFGTLSCSGGCTLDTSACTNDRYVDNGDETVTDNQTGLMWRNKLGTNLEWSVDSPQVPNGTAFTNYLAGLNRSESNDGMTALGCFANHCDWHIPTIVELKTIQLESFPCATIPCLDPIFDPLWENLIICPGERLFIWSSTLDPLNSADIWGIDFCNGELRGENHSESVNAHAIAVRH